MGNPGRVLDDYSHRIGETKLLSDGDYRDYIVYAQCGPARRGGAPLKLTLPHTTVHAQPLTYSTSYYKQLQPNKIIKLHKKPSR